MYAPVFGGQSMQSLGTASSAITSRIQTMQNEK